MLKACEGTISQKSVEKKIKWKKNKIEFEKILDKCIENNNTDNNFEVLFWHIPTDLSYNKEIEIYRKYLLQENHFEHEEIVGTFQTYLNKSPKNIDFLLKAIENIPEHLSSDDFKYPYIRKCIYAIGAQPEPSNFKGLNKLLRSNDNEIIQLAKHQIEKRKKLGQFEKK